MEKFLNAIGLSLLGICFVVALGRIAWRYVEVDGVGADSVLEIRLAHWQLEGGVREALDHLAANYMEANPGVRITQIPIPERIYTNWLLTQLIGGTAPDIIQIGMGTTDERLARYFVPLTELAGKPNPYNQGTELEGVPLRETFFDGMEGGFIQALLEYYGVPLSAYTVRLYVNLGLLEEVTGGTELPQTYEEIIELCERVQEFTGKDGQPIIPIAGSRYNAPFLMQKLFSSQTQQMSRREAPPGSLSLPANQKTKRFFEGAWSLDSPEIYDGLTLMREVGTKMQPGFMQVTRDDAGFYFMQGKALMIATGSWDAMSIWQQAQFRFRAIPIPLPSPGNEIYGKNVLGEISEAGTNAGMLLGLTTASKHPEVAVDFLLFLASQPNNEKFVQMSNWLPSVLGVQPAELASDFMIEPDGYTPGFVLAYSTSADAQRVLANAIHRLFAPEGGEEAFLDLIRPYYAEALLSDLQRNRRNHLSGLRRSDVQLAGVTRLLELAPDDTARQEKFDMMAAAFNSQDRGYYFVDFISQMAEEKQREDQP